MKKIAVIIISFLFLCSCSNQTIQQPEETEADNKIRAVWIYYRELSMIDENGGTAQSFKNKINKIFSDCKGYGLNTVFVQIRPFSDSFYPSDIFPWSEYLTGEQGKSVNYDPLQIMLNCAKDYNLSFHAWLNPFRITFDDFSKLSESHPAFNFKESDVIFQSDNGIYFNPASLEAQKLVLDGIREIVTNYKVDGIHIDDYFYPTADEKIDQNYYKEYKEKGGTLPLNSWRIQNINAFVSGMYQTVKGVNSEIIVSISPAGNISNNYKTLYADVNLWSGRTGYCDMIMPQLYFGFNHKTLPFETALSQWAEINTNNEIKLICGIGAYKAAEPENNEWQDVNIIKKQVDCALNSPKYDGYCLFSYSSLLKLSSDAFSEKRSGD
ncbi:MAG: family 10 glycosylhydrolase [Clostridia bacterium]|nr:family 10 glycosylhydrolase [Clostridia bacterium]